MFKTLQTTILLLCFVFTQNIQAQYCAASGSNTSDEWIQSVSIGGFNHTSGNNNGYENLTNQTINLSAGNNYNVALTPGYSGTQYDEYWRIWIDLNDDGDFSDSGELVYSSGGGNAGTTMGTLVVPSGTSTGTTRLRVAMKWVGETSDGTIDNDPPNSCGTFEFGEVEDYTVNIGGGGSGDNYCAASGESTVDEWIQSITIGAFSNNSGNNNGYLNATNQSILLNAGNSYNITLTPGYAGTQYDESWRIWIDFNNDNDFNDPGELIYAPSAGQAGTVNSNITIQNVAATTTRMRVAMKWVGETSDGTIDNNPPSSCGTFEFGEVEDYTVTIGDGGSDDSYCTANGSNVSDEWVQVIAIGNFTNTSGNNGGYLNATNQTININNTSTNVTLTPGYTSTQYDEYWRIWIDLNKDNDFTDANELVYDAGAGNAGTVTGSLTIPANTNVTDTRLRVAMKWVGETSDGTIDNAPPNACGTFEFGEVEDYTVNVNVGSGGNAPVANFTSNVTTGNAPLTVNFMDSSTNNPTGWSWNFPGGSPSTSTVQNPTVVYNTPGTYTVTLTASNAAGGDVETKTGYITVTENAPTAPVANFTSNVTTGNAPLTVSFTDNSTNNPTAWSWNFPGGSPESANTQNPTVVYNTPGTYTVILTASNAAGSDVESKTGYITVLSGGGTSAPVANFNSNVTSGNAPLTVNFTDNSTNNPNTWSWNFPGGTPNTSNLQNPTVVYNTPGTYSVILTATNSAGGDVENKTAYITVFDNTPTAPVANFSANVTSGTAPLTVNLTDLSANNPTSWFWSLSGGTPSTANTQNPTVVYSTPGTYTISLTASNATGSDIETKNAYITVTAPGNSAPKADFTSNITTGDAPLTVNFFDISSNNPTSWAWSFPGGSPATATVQNPTVIYNAPGTYQVTLTASNNFGADTETKTGYITVGNQGGGVAPVAAFSASIFEGNAPLVVTFFDQSVNNPLTWSWEMPGAIPDVSGLKNPTVTYNNPGTFPVTLTVTNASGSDSETESMYITVLPPVSVENPENGGAIIVAPNPTEGFIRVHLENTLSEITSANMYNNLGQMVKTLSLQNNTDQWEFDISELPDGMYILHLNIAGENYAYPILKK